MKDIQKLQLTALHAVYDNMQTTLGHVWHHAIYGAGCIKNPHICLVFMNPTARNLSAQHDRTWLRAPRIGLKQTRKMLYELGFISQELCTFTQGSINNRDNELVQNLYQYLSDQGIFITNLAKCTQSDAKHLPDSIFKEYMPIMHQEISILNPQKIITFGNQVSSILLNQSITVSSYPWDKFETISIENKDYRVYPCRYPVGMGFRNIHKAKERINIIRNA